MTLYDIENALKFTTNGKAQVYELLHTAGLHALADLIGDLQTLCAEQQHTIEELETEVSREVRDADELRDIRDNCVDHLSTLIEEMRDAKLPQDFIDAAQYIHAMLCA